MSGQVSIERVFREVLHALPHHVRWRSMTARFRSRGFWPRVCNMFEAAFHQGDVNHITGDVHFLAILLAKRRTLLTIHDCAVLERLTGFRWWIYYIFWYWLPVRRSSIISVISESARRELLRYLPCDAAKVRVIHDPCPSQFQADPRLFNEENPVILQVGAQLNKNLLRVADALRGMRCRLRIIGRLSGEQVRKLQDFQIDYSAVADLSDRELVDEYRRCDMVVFASTYEGFGLPILEAQATGRPVVTSNVLSMPEVAGDGACLADPFDEASIRGAIERVIHDAPYREKLVRDGYRNIERFQPQQIARQYLELYQETCPATEPVACRKSRGGHGQSAKEVCMNILHVIQGIDPHLGGPIHTVRFQVRE